MPIDGYGMVHGLFRCLWPLVPLQAWQGIEKAEAVDPATLVAIYLKQTRKKRSRFLRGHHVSQ